jgi:RimJ/RimL family protein N-acetyltransferase
MLIRSDRLTLRNWRDSDRAAFAVLNATPEVTQDLGGPLSRSESDAKFDRYMDAFAQPAGNRPVAKLVHRLRAAPVNCQ